MKTKVNQNDKQHYIYIRSTRERISVTKQEFDDYYRDINAYRKKEQRHGRCVCPKSKWLDCDMDCVTCPFSSAGDNLSLDYTTADENGNEQAWVDKLPDESALIEDIVANKDEFAQILAKLCELMPEALQIGELRLNGHTDVSIATIIGIPNTTFRSRLERAKKVLSEEFPEIF